MSAYNDILQYLSRFASLIGGDNIYKSQLESAKRVDVVKCTDVLTDSEISYIRGVLVPQAHMCYRNALLASSRLGFEYCEGYIFHCIPIEHAFNKVGDKYIDITAEFALNEDPSQSTYVSIGEYKAKEAEKVALKTKVYGGVYEYMFNKKKS